MERKKLLEKLKTVSPALSSNELIPIMTHFWFTGEDVMAYNDIIAISIPCKTEFMGAVPGKVLVDILSRSKARKVLLEPSKNSLMIKAASSRIKLPFLPPDEFIFEFPEFPDVKESDVFKGELFREGIKICLMSVGLDSSIPEQLGVTVKVDDDGLVLYSTNGATLSCARICMKEIPSFKSSIILPSLFCRQLLELSSKGSLLSVQKDHSLLKVKSGARVFGRLLKSEKPLEFETVLKYHIPDRFGKKMVLIPSKMKGILDRAMVITDIHGDQQATDIEVKDGVVRFFSKSERGHIKDRMQITGNHPDIKTRIEPGLLSQGYGVFDKIFFSDSCAIMWKRIKKSRGVNEFLYLIAAYQTYRQD